MDKDYLGDGVYVEVERGMLKLTTSTTNTIFLEVEDIDRIRDMAIAEDYQLWIEKVCKTGEGCTVFIQDGSVYDADAETVEAESSQR